MDKGTTWIDLSKGKNIEQTIDLFNKRRGIFRLLANFDGSNGAPAELVYSVLPPNTHLNEMYEAGFLGTDTNLRPDTLQILKRANFNWALSKFTARWSAAEPQKGHFVFNDEAVENARKAGVTLVLQICWTNTPDLKWAAEERSQKGRGRQGLCSNVGRAGEERSSSRTSANSHTESSTTTRGR